MGVWMARRNAGRMKRQKEGEMGGRMGGWVDEWIDGRRDGRTDGRRVGRTVGRTDGRVCVARSSGRPWNEENLSTARPKTGSPSSLALEICHQKLAVHPREIPTWPGRGGDGRGVEEGIWTLGSINTSLP